MRQPPMYVRDLFSLPPAKYGLYISFITAYSRPGQSALCDGKRFKAYVITEGCLLNTFFEI
jgi:hypothetical protein